MSEEIITTIEKKVYFKPIVESVKEVLNEGEIPFLWGAIKEGSFGFVFGPSKSGKTTFCENLAMSLVCNQGQFLGNAILQKDHRVLFISLEEYAKPRSERNDKQIKFMGNSGMLNNLSVINDEFPKFIREEADYELLENTIRESEAEIIFIDSLTRIGTGDIERSDNAKIITSKLKKISYDCGVTMIVIHHTPKLNGKMISMDSLAGSHVLAQEADFIIGINKYNGKRYLKEVASRYKREDDEKVLTFNINDNMWLEPTGQISEYSIFDELDGRTDKTNREAVLALIRRTTEDNGSNNFSNEDIIVEATANMDRSTVYQKLDSLIDSGDISRIKKGQYKLNNTSVT